MRDRLCAVCGRPVDGLEDAREAGGQWFCTQGHFLSYEARPRRRSPRGREVGGVLVGLVLLGALVWVIHPLGKRRGIDAAVPAGFHVQIDRKSMTNSYSAIKVGQCLFNHGIPDGVQAATQDQRFASFPPGVVSDLDTAAFLISGPPFSDLNIYFFGTPILARQGARRLAALDIYDQGIPSTATNKAVRAFLNTLAGLPKPNLSQADKLETVFGNAVVIWQRPFEHPRYSKRILDACLAAST